MGLGLRPLSHDRQAQGVGQLVDGGEQRGIGHPPFTGEERSVELQEPERKPAQPLERGVPGAEVVDPDHHARIRQHFQAGDRPRPLHEGGLGHLQQQAPRFEARFGQGL